MDEAEDGIFHVFNKEKEEKELFHSHHPSPMEIHLRIHAIVDIGDFLLGFTIEDIGGAHEARVRVFDLHTRAWLPTPVPILPSVDGEELPIDGRWQMEMIDYSTIICIYSNPSHCRLIYLHLDRSPTKLYPLSLFVSHFRDIRPSLSNLLDSSLNCTVLYERKDCVEKVTIVTDNYQFDRDSVRVHVEDEEGKIVQIGPCNLTNTTDNHLIARCPRGNVLLTRKRGEVRSGQINKVINNMDTFRSPFTIVDSSGFLWTLDANELTWKKEWMRLPSGNISSITHSWNGRLLCVKNFKRKKCGRNAEPYEVFQPIWQWIQPPSLKDLAQAVVSKEMSMKEEEMSEIHHEMQILRRDYDATTAFVMAIQKRRRDQCE